MAWRVHLVWLVILVAGCSPGPATQDDRPAVVFVLDSAINRDFIEGRVIGLQASDVSHGSLVGRVVLSYCRARLISVPVEDPDGKVDRDAYLRGLRTVLDYAEEHPGAKVVANVSLASRERGAEEEELIGRLTERGVLVVAAAGNDDGDVPMYPAAYPGVVAVASATGDGKALHSNFGPHIDIAASGDIRFIDYDFLPYERLRREMDARGTSFAAPRVAATVAYVLNRAPHLSAQEAYGILAATARPIDDTHFRKGLLGAGLLDIRLAKGQVAPGYRFAHFVLPVCVWVILGLVSGYLCWRHGLVGVFVALMMWLMGLPASYLLVIELGLWLQFVGRGSLVVGLGAGAVLCTGGVLSLFIQAGNLAKTVVAALVYGLFAAVAGAGLAGGFGAIYLALAAAAVAVAAAVAWESATRRELAVIRSLPGAQRGITDRLLCTHRWTLDRRVRRAVIGMLGHADDEAAVEFLLKEPRYPRLAVDSLSCIAGRDVSPLIPGLRGFAGLNRGQQRRILLALRKAGNPDAIPYLEDVTRAEHRRDVQEVLSSLREATDRQEI